MCPISVILPSLNVRQYIDECLQSVMNQSLKNIEIICVDAGSTDGTLEIIKKYCEKDSRIKLILSQKKSYGYQMNLGISQATGEYIGIVETDDFVPSKMYESLYNIAKKQNAQIVKADFYRFKTIDGKIERTYNRLDTSGTFYNRIINPAKEKRIFRFIMNTWSGIYQREFLEKNQIKHNESDGASFQDNGFFFKTFACADRVFFVNQPFYMNRRDNENSSVANKSKVYTMTSEWNYIYDWLKTDNERLKTFKDVYFLKKYHNLSFTLQRIGDEYKEEFINHFSNEMKTILSAKKSVRKIFTVYEWRRIKLIAKNPQNYYRMRKIGCTYNLTLRILKKIGNIKRFSKFLIKIDGKISEADRFSSFLLYEGPLPAIRRVKWKNIKDIVTQEQAHD